MYLGWFAELFVFTLIPQTRFLMGNVCGTVIGPLRDWVFLFLGHLFFFLISFLFCVVLNISLTSGTLRLHRLLTDRWRLGLVQLMHVFISNSLRVLHLY